MRGVGWAAVLRPFNLNERVTRTTPNAIEKIAMVVTPAGEPSRRLSPVDVRVH